MNGHAHGGPVGERWKATCGLIGLLLKIWQFVWEVSTNRTSHPATLSPPTRTPGHDLCLTPVCLVRHLNDYSPYWEKQLFIRNRFLQLHILVHLMYLCRFTQFRSAQLFLAISLLNEIPIHPTLVLSSGRLVLLSQWDSFTLSGIYRFVFFK